MTYQDTMGQINDRRREMSELRKNIRALQAAVDPQPVADYTFRTTADDVTLSSLFGDREVLFVVHNMGKSCPSCTMWADGLNGVLDHLEDRAAFVVSSPDSPSLQKTFAESRGWKFRMVSHDGTTFAKDMGYVREYEGKESFWPGVSVFTKESKEEGDQVLRVSDTSFGPGDDFNAALNLFDLIPEGADDWMPRLSYR